MTSAEAPVVFIHGLWLHASSWQPWQDLAGPARLVSEMPLIAAPGGRRGLALGDMA